MEDFVYITILFDYYGCLLTDKQQEYFINYYENNLTMQEIADNNQVSKNAVSKQLEIIKDKLLYYEEKLSLYNKKNRVIDIIQDEKLISKLDDLI